MPLSSVDRDPVRDPVTEGLSFIMLDGYLKVRCRVTSEALSSLDFCLTTIEKITRFFEHRDLIEAAASRLYDGKQIEREGIVLVTGRALRDTRRW